ncbi:DUF5337 domain-containing protein [Phaeovulum sp. NW3]|uniref:DUF5337 domain-containing protein n=1 Tax=Phaeovulum sp. NW3 TaxID=2934933 RepID=UPI002020C8FE|nr:DUF5337 domain-containing protein [Phaeovulum sp. NW3]MCL7465376.1 DUF5337 domain-containing protein [Phaeovulum sp. NW3]
MAQQGGQNGLNAREGRLAALVIAAATVLWLAAQWLGKRLGLDPSIAFLIDLAAIAAYVFALVVTWRIWRRGSGGSGN